MFEEDMPPLCPSPLERSRNAVSRVLQAMQVPGMGVSLAASLGKSESEISRIKNDRLEDVMALVHHLGFKLVSNDKVCVQKDELNMLRQTYARAVQNQHMAEQLFGGDE
jgi:hypothetical protein